jgi:hypothetical protein
MNARIDPLAQQLEVGGRTYRLRLDCRAEAALVTVGEREYRVRLLQWREKAMLARFAPLGEELVMREFVRMCVDGSDDLPQETAAILGEAAAWINDPSGAGAGVPFDSRSVATVMLQLCRATQLRPADLDGRSALEVEEMWQALGGETPATPREPESPSATRIMIVPDPEPAQSRSNDSVPIPTTSEELRGTPRNPEEPRNPSPSQAKTPTNATPIAAPTAASAVNATSVAPTERWRLTNLPGTVSVFSPETSGTAPSHRTPAASRPGTSETRPTHTSTHEPSIAQGHRAIDTRAAIGSAHHPEPTAAFRTETTQLETSLRASDARAEMQHSQLRTRSDRTVADRVLPAQLPAPSELAQDSAPSFDNSPLFDELADRLAEAAADMGIGEV